MNTIELPDWLPPFPPVPEGYDRWEARGFGWSSQQKVLLACTLKGLPDWNSGFEKARGLEGHFYLEAIKDDIEEIDGWSKQGFIYYLTNTLIPDCEEAKMVQMAKDLKTAVRFLENN